MKGRKGLLKGRSGCKEVVDVRKEWMEVGGRCKKGVDGRKYSELEGRG